MQIKTESAQTVVKPLERVTVRAPEGTRVTVRDGKGRTYAEGSAAEFVFSAAGALGTHLVEVRDDSGSIVAQSSFPLQCETDIDDASGHYRKLLQMLHYTMVVWGEYGTTIWYNGKFYHAYVRWLRDHVHTLKGMKWFDSGPYQTGVELYADTQQPNGMIWDRNERHTEHETWRDKTFSFGGFIAKGVDGKRRFERIPVENDVEFLFLEGIYYTWKAIGDDGWMSGLLDQALKAVEYSTTDPYRWSEKYQLLKRGYTVDTWDFQTQDDAARVNGESMVVKLDKTHFNIFHGDNTGFATSCRYLAEMLAHVGRDEEAARIRKLSEDIMQRLNDISWNGEFYTHMVPEEEGVERDLGNTDTSRQVSLSNAYATNRDIGAERAEAIVRTYQRIRDEMPEDSPGEFYQIYPPFDKGFGGHNSLWEYMNGGVTTIVAGELAHGAFQHGHEAYAAGVLDIVHSWGEAHEGYLHCALKGRRPHPPQRNFTPVDIAAIANADLYGEGGEAVPGWSSEGPQNDMRNHPVGAQEYEGIPFEVIDPSRNDRRAVLGISSREGYAGTTQLKIGRKAASVYLLHTLASRRSGSPAGELVFRYEDGSETSIYINRGANIGHWYEPSDPKVGNRHQGPTTKVAWRGRNETFGHIGDYVAGISNPHPEKEIEKLKFRAANNDSLWMVLGVTLCDAEVWMDPGDVSFGIPDNWGAAAVVYALIEGLAGIKDAHVAFDKAELAPRWAATNEKAVRASGVYPASGGYLSYRYALDETANKLTVEFATSADETAVRILLPEGRELGEVLLNGERAEATSESVRESRYACFSAKGVKAWLAEVTLA